MGKIIKNGIVYGGHSSTAATVSYDNLESGLESTTVQNAIDELDNLKTEGITRTLLYSAPSSSLSYTDITLSQPWTSYDQLLFLMISKDNVNVIRCQVLFDVKSLIDKTPNIFFLLPDEANVGSFVLYVPDVQDNTVLKYTDQHNNFVYVHSIYGIKFSRSRGEGFDPSILGTLAYKDNASGEYIPMGTVSAPTITVTPTTSTVTPIATVGTLPELIYNTETEELSFS